MSPYIDIFVKHKENKYAKIANKIVECSNSISEMNSCSHFVEC